MNKELCIYIAESVQSKARSLLWKRGRASDSEYLSIVRSMEKLLAQLHSANIEFKDDKVFQD